MLCGPRVFGQTKDLRNIGLLGIGAPVHDLRIQGLFDVGGIRAWTPEPKPLNPKP